MFRLEAISFPEVDQATFEAPSDIRVGDMVPTPLNAAPDTGDALVRRADENLFD
jgi:hypothetical protein